MNPNFKKKVIGREKEVAGSHQRKVTTVHVENFIILAFLILYLIINLIHGTSTIQRKEARTYS
jgi:hypothetical protein